MLKPTVVTDSSLIGLEVEWGDGPEVLTGNLLPVISWCSTNGSCKSFHLFRVLGHFYMRQPTFFFHNLFQTSLAHLNPGVIYHRLAVSCVVGSDNLPRTKKRGREGD